MPRDPESGASSLMATFGRMTSASKLTSSSSKYRVSHSNSNLVEESSSAATQLSRVSAPSVPSLAAFMPRGSIYKRSSSTTDQQIGIDTISSPTRSEVEQDQASPLKSQPEGKLPHKLRRHVSQLRSQVALLTAVPTSGSTTSPTSAKSRNASPSPPRPSNSVKRPLRSSKRLSIASPQYSRQSQQMQRLQEMMKAEASDELRRTSIAGDLAAESASPIAFLDLLRPLQNSLSCGSLMSEWPSDSEEEDAELMNNGSDVASERGRSRMLRICCSIDNLLLSIGNQVQQEKLDTEIVRGSARELVRLFQFALKQVILLVFNTPNKRKSSAATGGSPQRHEKEAQYAFEFFEEIMDRFGKLDTFVRSTLLDEIKGLRSQISELQAEYESTRQLNDQLQSEMADLRDFHAQNGVASLSLRGPELVNDADDDALGFHFTSDSNQRDGAPTTEVEQLKKQCDEYARVLEMAKQEIRISHHERDVHKAHVVELTSSLFRDTELGALRNQLQSEKKRVKILEMENVALLECQHDQSLKIESLLANKAPPSSTSATNKQPSEESTPVRTHQSTTNPQSQLSVDTTVDQRPYAISDACTATAHSDTQILAGGSTESSTKQFSARNWFMRLVEQSKRGPLRTDIDMTTSAGRLRNIIATLPSSVIDQTNARRRAGVPAIAPASLGIRISNTGTSLPTTARRKRKQKATSSGDDGNPELVNIVELEHSCRCLIWFFLQQYMMAQEVNELLTGFQMSGCGAPTPNTNEVTLESIIYHFYLERAASDAAALTDTVDFIQCLQVCRSHSFEVEIFCSFLEGRRTRDQLDFLLWVLQVIQRTEVGISYDDPASSTTLPAGAAKQDETNPQRRYVCSLKAMFVVRTAFRLLQMKTKGVAHPSVLQRRPSTAPSRSSTNTILKPQSPTSPSRRTLKSQASVDLLSCYSNDDMKVENTSLADRAIASMRNAIQANGGRPITLESFSHILEQYAEYTSPEELYARIGPFYRPTSDERKIPWDVLIVLLLEMYQYQVEWQRKQLRSLFMHLHWQQEMEERVAAKKKAADLALLAAATKKRAGPQQPASPKKRPKQKKRSKNHTVTQETSSDPDGKYLVGLSRSILRHLLVASAVLENEAQIDIDWLFICILNMANRTADEINFDAVYDALRSLRIIPDWSRRLRPTTSQDRQSRDGLAQIAHGLQKHWQILTSTSLALCENDPNVFVRKQTFQWRTLIGARMSPAASQETSSVDILQNIDSIRTLLWFAWRVGAKRSLVCRSETLLVPAATCLSELHFANQTVRAAIDPLQGYSTASIRYENQDCKLHGSLSCFYATECMHLAPHLKLFFTKEETGGAKSQSSRSVQTPILDQIQHVLQRYAVHFNYLFNRYRTLSLNETPRVSLHQWRQLVYELALVHPVYLTLKHHHKLFLGVANGGLAQAQNDAAPVCTIEEPSINPSQFAELFVVIAFELFHGMTRQLRAHRNSIYASSAANTVDGRFRFEDIWKQLHADNESSGINPALVVALFLQEVLAKLTFPSILTTHEMCFSHKLTCPLVMRELLEHRTFLRSVFFYYAKQDEDAADLAASLAPENLAVPFDISNKEGEISFKLKDSVSEGPGLLFQLEKTKRNSMSFEEFQMFLREFQLMCDSEDLQSKSKAVLGIKDAQHIFENVMAVDNADVAQLEFDEFAGAIVALAVYFTPDPFTLWHEKINLFVSSLKIKLHGDDVRLKY